MEGAVVRKTVCITGAGGFLASWLVKLLLSNGYRVHGTVRDPSDEKNAHLKKLEKAAENLRLFKADLLDYNALSAAIAGCEGVFHVATPVPSDKVSNPEEEVITPAVTGTLNVLKACSEAKVKRVVVVSSVGAVVLNPNWPGDRVKDEDCWSDKEFCKTTENWYCLSKTLAEAEALDYGKKHGLYVVTVCPAMIIGPLLQSTVNASSMFLLRLMKGTEALLHHQQAHFLCFREQRGDRGSGVYSTVLLPTFFQLEQDEAIQAFPFRCAEGKASDVVPSGGSLHEAEHHTAASVFFQGSAIPHDSSSC